MNTKDILIKYPPEKAFLLDILHEIQDNNPNNYLPENELEETAEYLKMTKAELYGTVSYYSMFSLKPRGKYIIRFCISPVCEINGRQEVAKGIMDYLKIRDGETTEDGLFTFETCECLGKCGIKPSMMINKDLHGGLTKEKAINIINQLKIK